MVDLLSGRVQLRFDNLPTSVEYIKAGKLRPLAVTTAARSDVFPDLPTVGDFVPGYEASAWYGIGAPKGTPAEIIDTLNRVAPYDWAKFLSDHIDDTTSEAVSAMSRAGP